MKKHLLPALFLLVPLTLASGCMGTTDALKAEANAAKAVLNVGPAFSRDDATLYFASDRAGNGNLYKLPLATTAAVILTTFASDEWTCRGCACPDGTTLLVETNAQGRFAIARFSPVTSLFTAVRSVSGVDFRHPSYSADGASIVYSRLLVGVYKIFMANADGSGERQISSGAGNDYKPTLSKTGEVVFYRVAQDQSDLFVIDTNDANLAERNLTATGSSATYPDEYDPVFSPSLAEERVVFVQGTRGGSGRIVSMLLDRSSSGVLVETAGEYADVALSYNGQRMAYAYRATPGTGDFDLYLANANGQLIKRLTRGSGGADE